MNRIKHRFILGAMAGGVLLASCLVPAQVVLAATASSDTPATTSDTTTPQTTTANTPDNGQGQSTPSSSNGNQASGQTTSTGSAPSTSPDSSSTTTNTSGAGSGSNSPANTTSQTGANSASNSSQDNNTTQAVNASTISTAKSGDVNAKGNLSSVGNATSGNSSSTDTEVNVLNSSTSLNNAGGLQTFTFDINGNHVGDILLSPAEFLQSSVATAVINPENASATDQIDSTITNTIDLSATSGNVTVEGNGSAGNAASGNAATEANIINMVNSVVSDKQAFVGMVNINGNLKGNLLLPKSAIDSLLPNPSQPSASTSTGNTTTTIDNNLNINNNVTLDAQSGKVMVEGNGSAGNATSGDATTGLKLYNLTNSQIVGGNVLLVFVNVEGSWVGLLMNAPAGTTSAALGGGIAQDTVTANSSTTSSTTETINNDVNLTSKSGNVAAKGNGKVGNATSGNANANADIVNIMGSQVDLTGWLGVLVINVYGSWNGSLEIQPAQVTIHVKAPPTHHHATKRHSTTTTTASHVSNATSKPQTLQTNHIVLAAAHVLGDATGNRNVLDGGKHIASTTNDSLSKGRRSSADILLTGIGVTLAISGGVTQLIANRHKKVNVSEGSNGTNTTTTL